MAPAARKLTDQQVKTIRRRNNKGEHLTALALAYEVNRKTLRRRLDALAHAEAERAQRIAATRRGRQAAAERQTLTDDTRECARCARARPTAADRRSRCNPQLRPILSLTGLSKSKNLSGRARSHPAAWYVSATATAPFNNGSSPPWSTTCSNKAGRSPELSRFQHNATWLVGRAARFLSRLPRDCAGSPPGESNLVV